MNVTTISSNFTSWTLSIGHALSRQVDEVDVEVDHVVSKISTLAVVLTLVGFGFGVVWALSFCEHHQRRRERLEPSNGW